MTAYRFIDEYKDQFGVRWLLRRLNIFPNAYYNYKKHRKAAYEEKKQYTKEQIKAIYHEHNGVDGYRMMRAYLERKGIKYQVVCRLYISVLREQGHTL